MVKGSYSMIQSYTFSEGTPVPIECRGLPMDVDCLASLTGSEIQLLTHTCLSNQYDGCVPTHAVLQRNPSSPLPCSAPTYGS